MATSSFTPSRFAAVAGVPDCRPHGTCDPMPVCPACGGLECLCRPRFFAGQLLTEDELNRLDHYIVAKHRLHNRYLHGWGVACGLEVVCGVCGDGARGRVVVKSGYALSPCGNDIVVCGDQAVDICELIARCRPDDDMCAVPHDADPDDCGGGTEEWILGICYHESASRGVTALMNRASPGKCGCGGGGTGGCGCGGSKPKGGDCSCGKKHGHTHTKPPVPPSCEPTLTCEGYRFAVWKAPKKPQREKPIGAAAKRYLCCIAPFLTALGQFPPDATADQLAQWYLDMRDTVREFLLSEGLYDCTIAAQLALAVLPKATGNADEKKLAITTATLQLSSLSALVIQKCLCAALLPRCPDHSDADCVPLATVTVRRRPCEVVRICNLSARKFLVTIPNIGYWLSFFTGELSASLRQFFEKMCCGDLVGEMREYTDTHADTLFAGHHAAPGMHAAAHVAGPALGESAFARIMADALARPERAVNAGTLLLAAMGAKDAAGQPLASDLELAHPADFLLLNQIVAPALRMAGSGFVPAAAGAAAGASTADLARELADLRKTVEHQQATIDQLRKKRR